MDEKQQLDVQIQDLLKKYKLTMWAIVACIALYLVFLFLVKTSWSTYVVLALCVVMIVLAVMNSRYSKAIQKLAKEKNELIKAEKIANGEIEEVKEDAIVANAASLNDLPKAYTVLDDVVLGDKTAEHIVLSPYGVAIVSSTDVKPEVEAVLKEKDIESPVFVYDASLPVGELAQQIQQEKTPALGEDQIMTVLYTLSGLNK